MSSAGGWGGGPPQEQPGAPPGHGGFGSPPGQGGGALQPQASSSSPSGLAVAALICGIGSWVVLPFVAAVAGVILGKIELGKIERGESPAAGKTFAQVGYYASIANIVLTVLGTIFGCCIAFIIPMVIAGGAAASGGY